jgi:hypothetical protein
MSEQNNKSGPVALISRNQRVITLYYRIAIVLLVAVMLSHVLFAASLIITGAVLNSSAVLAFAVFNATVIVVEVILGRITFMVASRAGQLHDLRVILSILGEKPDPKDLMQTAKAIMVLRRDRPSTLRVFDVERVASSLQKPLRKP